MKKIYRIRFSAKELTAKENRNWRHNVTWQVVAETMLAAIGLVVMKAEEKYTELELHMVEYLGDVNLS